ncbi:LuxR C-terminal-related transcriptional regulator [Tabrizicola fusiformis]|uniref:LuxR C-terminal-related transcriptional regulator n=1 Tax=Tabrizicola sp. SY72 TaxID=2741673 RepID=UPI001571EA00|nr:LuxR C-terminal-related transcriptional regulator [Tabrizicola sp. SY72]NTT87228.1 PAS domain S-box protein [Tabrizicola sp. SY72]
MPPAPPSRARDLERLAFQNAPDATLILADRIILHASLRVEAVFGWTPREVEGQSVRMLYPGQTDYEVIGARARKAMQDQPVYHDERFMRRKDGQVVWMEGRGAALDRDDPQRLAIWTYRPLESGAGPANQLTPAEKRVARYLVNGFTSKEIALALECSPRTVEVHRANMVRKLMVRNSFELVHRLLAAPPT